MLQEVELWNPKKEEIKEGITTQSIIQEDQEEKEPNDIISDETLQGGNYQIMRNEPLFRGASFVAKGAKQYVSSIL